MIYCEAIPNTAEAILVIVKSGSVYLDGSFPLDSIPEELVVFISQQNNFNIYIHGDVPISELPLEGKFSFDASSVASFTVLDEPLFPKLPTVKSFQLQLVDTVLKAQGIGVLPTKQIIIGAILLILAWLGWSYLMTPTEEQPILIQTPFAPVEDGLQQYKDALTTPGADLQIEAILRKLSLVYTIPGWKPETIDYILNADNTGTIRILVSSSGVKIETLFRWAKKLEATTEISPKGIFLNFNLLYYKRVPPESIIPLDQIIGKLIDNLSNVIPGNNLQLGAISAKKNYSEASLIITLPNVSPSTFNLIGKQLRGLPLTLSKMFLKIDEGNMSGSINLKALGN